MKTKSPTLIMRQMVASITLSKYAYRKGYEAEDLGKSERSCRFRIPWLREAWMRGYRASAKARRPAEG